ncbi:MAG: SGNH/GDSL hydrolase family protein [Oligoflexia bacterium]|nr:SGNH/GDSL hydrolase family protein [Oligoflexia bacterium]
MKIYQSRAQAIIAFVFFGLNLLPFTAQPIELCTERTLIIGDSHTAGLFGHYLEKMFRKEFGKNCVMRVGAPGAATSDFVRPVRDNPRYCGKSGQPVILTHFSGSKNRSRELSSGLIPCLSRFQDAKPTRVVVALGSNQLDRGTQTIGEFMAALKLNFPNTQIVWVGPPDMRGRKSLIAKFNTELKTTLTTQCPECTVFLSSRVTRYPPIGGDGIHNQSVHASQSWARSVVDAIVQNSGKTDGSKSVR